MKKYLACLAAACFLASCIYPFTPELGDELDNETIVIDGTIQIGQQTEIAVRKMSPLSFSSPFGVLREDLAADRNHEVYVWLEDDKGTRYPAEYNGATGVRTIDLTAAPADRRYRLHVTVRTNDSGITRNFETPWLDVQEAPEIDNIYFVPDNGWVNVLVDAHAQGTGEAYFRFDFDETWEFHPPLIPEYYFDEVTGRVRALPETWENDVYNCWSSARPREQVIYSTRGLAEPKMERGIVNRFGRSNDRCQELYSILLKSMSLNREAYEYHETLAQQSNMGGNLFETIPSELRGNIRCVEDSTVFVIGYVSATTVKTRRAFLDGRYYIPYNAEAELFHPDFTDSSPREYYNSGFRPVKYWTIETDGNAVTALAWATQRCIDCVAAGGSKEKPDYWPNNHQ